jgi:predicted transcriptional regulator
VINIDSIAQALLVAEHLSFSRAAQVLGVRQSAVSRRVRALTNQAKFMHADLGRYWYSMSASLNRIAADNMARQSA